MRTKEKRETVVELRKVLNGKYGHKEIIMYICVVLTRRGQRQTDDSTYSTACEACFFVY